MAQLGKSKNRTMYQNKECPKLAMEISVMLKVYVESCQKWIVKISGAPNENNILSKILKNVSSCSQVFMCPFKDILVQANAD